MRLNKRKSRLSKSQIFKGFRKVEKIFMKKLCKKDT